MKFRTADLSVRSRERLPLRVKTQTSPSRHLPFSNGKKKIQTSIRRHLFCNCLLVDLLCELHKFSAEAARRKRAWSREPSSLHNSSEVDLTFSSTDLSSNYYVSLISQLTIFYINSNKNQRSQISCNITRSLFQSDCYSQSPEFFARQIKKSFFFCLSYNI